MSVANIYSLSHRICAAYMLTNMGMKGFVSLQHKGKWMTNKRKRKRLDKWFKTVDGIKDGRSYGDVTHWFVKARSEQLGNRKSLANEHNL